MNPTLPPGPEKTAFWPEGWWKWMSLRLGIIPLPVLLLVIAITGYFVHSGKVPNEVCMMMAVIASGGFLCAELGKRIPFLRNIGGAAICAMFIPSALQYYHILPTALTQPVTDFTKSTVFLYLFITMIVVGSILGMDRRILIQGFFKIFVPLGAGSVLAMLVGTVSAPFLV